MRGSYQIRFQIETFSSDGYSYGAVVVHKIKSPGPVYFSNVLVGYSIKSLPFKLNDAHIKMAIYIIS